MNLPDQPAAYRDPAGTDDDPTWWWRLEDETGQEVAVPEAYAGQRFPNQGDAESWVGEVFAELTGEGVDAVTLFEADRRVYGPMSLHP